MPGSLENLLLHPDSVVAYYRKESTEALVRKAIEDTLTKKRIAFGRRGRVASGFDLTITKDGNTSSNSFMPPLGLIRICSAITFTRPISILESCNPLKITSVICDSNSGRVLLMNEDKKRLKQSQKIRKKMAQAAKGEISCPAKSPEL